MTALRMCELGQISRASLYRWAAEAAHEDLDLDLRDEIQRIALEFPCYGRPRIAAELKRHGWKVNHKRVGRILREDNLLCLRKRRFVVTTDSHHNFRVYPNLVGSMDLTGKISCGSPTLPTSGWRRNSFTWPWYWTHIRVG